MKYFFALLTILFSASVFGASERFSSRIEGNTIATGAICETYDDKYFDMQTNPLWTLEYTNYKVSNKITLGLNREVPQVNNFTASVTLLITYDVWGSTGFTTATPVTRTLTVDYSTNGTVMVNDLSSHIFSGAHHVTIQVQSVSGVTNLNDIYIENEISVERYYAFDGAPPQGVTYAIAGTAGDYIDFSWNTKKGAEQYELEWVHINDYSINTGLYFAASELDYNYYLNSTRINTSSNHYMIPKIFDHGYILFRVRAVGRKGTDFSIRKDGVWSAAESGTVATHPSAQKITILTEYDHDMNWSHKVGYTEEGKRMEGTNYMDGLSRNRQSVAHNTQTGQAVVSNIYYDDLGRPVISDLPTPIDGEQLVHYPNFNRANVSGEPPFQAEYFDSTLADSCYTIAQAFSPNYGAGQYYSPNNPKNQGVNANIPDAELYPYSRITYTNDFTGRILEASGVGKDLKIGAGHETKFVYVSSNQEELDKLFGTEVGDKLHYQKMITVDLNGQLYVQYSDMAGRVVASFMAGEAPENLDEIEGNGNVNQTVHLINNGEGDAENLTQTSTSTTLTYDEYFYSDGTYRFTYGFTPEQYQDECMGDICFDCAYDLYIKITDDCDHVKWEETITINGKEFNDLCDGDETFTYRDSDQNAYKDIPLITGKYNILKQLTVNQAAIEAYWCSYINNSSCVEKLSDLFNAQYTVEEFPECHDQDMEIPEEAGCEDYTEIMKADVSPGGQYATYAVTLGTYTVTDRASVFYSGSNPALPGRWNTITYTDVTPASLIINGTTYTSPADIPLGVFIEHFDESWAKSLVENLHPERCYLQFICATNSVSEDFDQNMKAEYSFDGADQTGYFLPISGQSIPSMECASQFSSNTEEDPFFALTGQGNSYASAMDNKMDNYITIAIQGGTLTLDMWKYAVISAKCPLLLTSTPSSSDITECLSDRNWSCQNNDMIWVKFRDAYLEEKEAFVYLAMQDAVGTTCSNECIGVGVENACASPKDAFAEKDSRFGNASQFEDLIVDQATFENGANTQIASACQSTCEQYADEWINRLQGCDFAAANVNMTNFRNRLIELCMNGCDSEHPQGASTEQDGTSINDILTEYGLTVGVACTELLISEPLPYRPVTQMITQFTTPLDDCACDAIKKANSDFDYGLAHGTLPQGVTTIEQMLAYETGVSLLDVDYLICICNDINGGTIPKGGLAAHGWITNQFGNYVNPTYSVSPELACKEGSDQGCIGCTTIQTDVTALLATFPQGYVSLAELEVAAGDNYEAILTNYLNNTHFFTLTYQDYVGFIAGCTANENNPYCTVNPLATEWSEVMKLVAYRGELLTPAALSIDLMTQNIVYAFGELKNNASAHHYWSTMSGNNLILYYGDSYDNCTVTLTGENGSAFDFSRIVSFGTVFPQGNACGDNNNFKVEVGYLECGELHTAILEGTSTCFAVNSCVCGDNGQLLCNELHTVTDGICYQPRLDELYQNAMASYEQSVAAQYSDFAAGYNTHCSEAFASENFSYEGAVNTYQYTLFYYDQSGNLVQTIAPQGIDMNFQQTMIFDNVEEAKKTPETTQITPDHSFKTNYVYNSYDQLVSTTNPDQIGTTVYFYDIYGRIVASQNPVQADENKYAYTLYDKQGRPIEVGIVVKGSAPNDAVLKVVNEINPGQAFHDWVYAGTRSEFAITKYDKPSTTESRFANGKQENLRLRVAGVYYYELQSDATYTSAIHYSYDVHGNVKEQLQDVPMMAAVEQDIKSTEYEYELLSGVVQKVDYQKGKADYMEHRYEYDALNRLTEVFTTTDDVHKTQEAHYRYYDYGPLARTEIGEYKVQGMDYAYTINGWIKGMNASTLDMTRDMGKDGLPDIGSGTSPYLSDNTAVHDQFAKDVLGYTLGYFSGDYKAIGSSTMEATYGGSGFNSASTNLYNGNIRNIVTSITGMQTMGMAYYYDQLNRIKSATAFFNSSMPTANDWTNGASTADYFSSYTYDLNGNIQNLGRNGSNGDVNMDAFTYHYGTSPTGEKWNRLDYVADAGTDYMDGTLPRYSDIKHSGSLAQITGNYVYDDLGQLIYNASEHLTMEWKKGNKKLKSQHNDNLQVEYIYNPFGQRLMKIEKPCVNGIVQVATTENPYKYTLYTYDANGQVMGIYTSTNIGSSGKVTTDERNIYGAGRIGIHKKQIVVYDNGLVSHTGANIVSNELGNRQYEITNYLGNVNTIVSDRKTVDVGGTGSLYQATVMMTCDYFVGGFEMKNRSYQSSLARYGYNSMEKNTELADDGNSYTTEFRQYDSRILRWTSLDPLMEMFPSISPYVAFDNNPVYYIDPYGLSAGGPEEDGEKSTGIEGTDNISFPSPNSPTLNSNVDNYTLKEETFDDHCFYTDEYSYGQDLTYAGGGWGDFEDSWSVIGTLAHATFALYMEAKNLSSEKWATEVWLGSTVGTDANGRADLMYVGGSKGSVWEIKPVGYSKSPQKERALAQAQGYALKANALNYDGKSNWIVGNKNGTPPPFAVPTLKLQGGGYKFEFWLDRANPTSGLIFYRVSDGPKKQPENSPYPVVVPVRNPVVKPSPKLQPVPVSIPTWIPKMILVPIFIIPELMPNPNPYEPGKIMVSND